MPAVANGAKADFVVLQGAKSIIIGSINHDEETAAGKIILASVLCVIVRYLPNGNDSNHQHKMKEIALKFHLGSKTDDVS